MQSGQVNGEDIGLNAALNADSTEQIKALAAFMKSNGIMYEVLK